MRAADAPYTLMPQKENRKREERDAQDLYDPTQPRKRGKEKRGETRERAKKREKKRDRPRTTHSFMKTFALCLFSVDASQTAMPIPPVAH